MASNGASPQIPPNIAEGTAPLLIGVLLDCFLFGALTMQTFVYHTSFPNDELYAKLLVYSSYILQLVQVCCAAANISFWFGEGFGNLEYLNDVHLAPFDVPLIGSIIAFVVQLFFCYRIWMLEMYNRKLCISMCAVIGSISVVQLVAGITGAAYAYNVRTFTKIASSRPALVDEIIWLSGEALANVLIAGTMTYLLFSSTNDSEKYVRYPSVASRIVRLIVQTSSLTAGIAVIALILRLGLPDKAYYVPPVLMLGKLYSNTLLATFNHRLFLRQPTQQQRPRANVTVEKRAIEMVVLKETYSTPAHRPGQSSISSTASSMKGAPVEVEVAEIVKRPLPPIPKKPRPLPPRPGVDDVHERRVEDGSLSAVSHGHRGPPIPIH